MKKATDLLELCDQTVADYGERDTDLDELERYYFLTQDKDPEQVAAKEGIEIVRLPYATTAVDLVGDLLSGTDLTVVVPAMSEKIGDQRLADTAEKFLQAVLTQSSRAQRQDLLGRAAWLVAMRGAIAGRVIAMDEWIERDDEGDWIVGDRVPLLLQMRDPRYVYPEFGLDGLAYIVERQTRTARDIRVTLGADALPKRKDRDEIVWSEYWDDEIYCYWADGELVEKNGKKGPWLHRYGGIPYSYEFARQTGILDPDKRARPFLASIAPVIDRMEILDSVEATFIMQYNGDALVARLHPGEDGSTPTIDTRSGAIIYLEPDESLEWLRAGRQPVEVDKAYSKYQAQLERGTFPGSLYGIDPGRQVAGFAISLMNQSGQARLAPMIAAIERFMEDAFSNCLMLAEHILTDLVEGPIPFYVYTDKETDEGSRYKSRDEQKLDASKLKGVYRVDCTMGEVLPTDEQANIALAGRAREVGADGRPLLSWQTTIEKFKLSASPSDELDRIDREAAINSPEVSALRQAYFMATMIEEYSKRLDKIGIDPLQVLQDFRQPTDKAGPGQPRQAGPGQVEARGLPTSILPPQMQGTPQPMMQEPGAQMGGPMGPGMGEDIIPPENPFAGMGG